MKLFGFYISFCSSFIDGEESSSNPLSFLRNQGGFYFFSIFPTALLQFTEYNTNSSLTVSKRYCGSNSNMSIPFFAFPTDKYGYAKIWPNGTTTTCTYDRLPPKSDKIFLSTGSNPPYKYSLETGNYFILIQNPLRITYDVKIESSPYDYIYIESYNNKYTISAPHRQTSFNHTLPSVRTVGIYIEVNSTCTSQITIDSGFSGMPPTQRVHRWFTMEEIMKNSAKLQEILGSSNNSVGMIVGGIITGFMILIGILIIFGCCCQSKRSREANSRSNLTTNLISSSTYNSNDTNNAYNSDNTYDSKNSNSDVSPTSYSKQSPYLQSTYLPYSEIEGPPKNDQQSPYSQQFLETPYSNL